MTAVLGWIVRAQAVYEGGFEGAEGWVYDFEERLAHENPSFLYEFHNDFCSARDAAQRRH